MEKPQAPAQPNPQEILENLKKGANKGQWGPWRIFIYQQGNHILGLKYLKNKLENQFIVEVTVAYSHMIRTKSLHNSKYQMYFSYSQALNDDIYS